jgi:Xaa-Pro dipeptidase
MGSFARRIRRVFEGFDGDAILIYNTGLVDSNFTYLSGFTSGIFENTALLAMRNGMTLLTSDLEYETALSQRPKEMTVVRYSGASELRDQLRKRIEGKVVGVDASFLPYHYFRKLKLLSKARKFVDATDALSEARLVKEPSEIANIRKAVGIVKRTFNGIERHFKAGMTEKDLAAQFDNLMRLNGASEPSFKTIVAFGKNAALPHHAPDYSRLKPNEFVLIDAGAKYNNYCSDLTRTFIFMPDRRSEKWRRMDDMIKTVKSAQRLALESIKPGVDGRHVHRIAADYINKAEKGVYNGLFIHSLGHSIGIDVHDGPGLSPFTRNRLDAGMVVSDEPGIYLVGFGGVRFEDDVLVAENGASFL